MASIKFAKNGKTYKLLSKATKVTTPSIRIGNNYTPLFEGRPESEVISGDMIYTLSPLKVGKYNAAYKERPNFDGRVYVNVSCTGATGAQHGYWARSWGTSIKSAWTAQSGFSVSLSSNCFDVYGPAIFTLGHTFWYDFWYTVRSNITGEVVKSGHCSFSQYWDHGPMGIPQTIDRTVQISSAP